MIIRGQACTIWYVCTGMNVFLLISLPDVFLLKSLKNNN